MGHRATRRQARQNLVGLKKGQGIQRSGTFIFPERLAKKRGPEKRQRYSKNTQEVQSICSIKDAKNAMHLSNPKMHKGKVWKTGYRPSATTTALSPTRSSPLSTGRWAIARPELTTEQWHQYTTNWWKRYPNYGNPELRDNGQFDEMPYWIYDNIKSPVRRYAAYAEACFWRDRLNRLLRRRFNLWYTIVDTEV